MVTVGNYAGGISRSNCPDRRLRPLLAVALRTARIALLLVACGTLCVERTSASSFQNTEEFADTVSHVRQYVDQYGVDNVLFVADIDNTLLAMDEPLGSETGSSGRSICWSTSPTRRTWSPTASAVCSMRRVYCLRPAACNLRRRIARSLSPRINRSASVRWS